MKFKSNQNYHCCGSCTRVNTKNPRFQINKSKINRLEIIITLILQFVKLSGRNSIITIYRISCVII